MANFVLRMVQSKQETWRNVPKCFPISYYESGYGINIARILPKSALRNVVSINTISCIPQKVCVA